MASLLGGVGIDGQPADPQPAVAEIDVDLLLGSDRVLSDTLDDPVWDVEPRAGRRLIQLPVSFLAGPEGQETTVFEKPVFEFPGGRFLFWSVPEPEMTRPTSRPSRSGPLPQELTDEQLLDLAGLLSREEADSRVFADRAAAMIDEEEPEVSPDAPRIAREIFVSPGSVDIAEASPGGRIAWEVHRPIAGLSVKSAGDDQLYALRLDREQLLARQPERGDRLTRNADESSREFNLRRRVANAEQRELTLAYRDLQQAIRELPERVEQDLPPTVWAVFEINALGDGWSLRGIPAGDWSMRFSDWDLLTELAGRSSGRSAAGDGDFSTEELAGIRRLTELAGDPHPWTQRLLSAALSGSDLPGRASPGDSAARLMAAVLASPDAVNRNRLAYALAQLDPATPAAAELLSDAARATRDEGVQLAALRAEIGVQLAELNGRNPGPAAGQAVVSAVVFTNAMLADENGPDAGRVVEEFLSAIPDTPETNTAVVGGLRFDNLPDERFDAAVSAVLQNAGTSPDVVGGLVNRQLLGSANREVVERTLDLLGRADEPAPLIEPIATGLQSLVFGPPAADRVAPPRPMIADGLPLDSANHSLFRLLNAGDPELRKKGWLALRYFELSDNGRSSAGNEGGADPLTTIVDAGLSQADATPNTLVPFLARQPDADRANPGLIRVVIEGDASAARRAVRVLRGSERSFGAELAEFDADGREIFANRVYDTLGDGPEPVVGLIRIETTGGRGGVVGWFADALAEGELPEAIAWAEAVGGERALMQATVGMDDNLAAGAFAALTAADGGDRELQFKMIDRFKDDRTTKTPDQMAEAWVAARQDIYTARLADAAGDYRIVMIVTGIGPAAGADGAIASDPVLGNDPSVITVDDADAAVVTSQRTTLGVTRLIANGRSLSFVGGTPELGVPEDRLAIRIPTVSQIKAFDATEVQDLPLEDIEEPLDLLPEPGGRWRGEMMLPDGRDLELVMEPWGGAATPADDSSSSDTRESESPPTRSGGELQRSPFGN
ncbi:MAG: hypothetical protein AAGH99_03655 [Planctomycetota bacterium]